MWFESYLCTYVLGFQLIGASGGVGSLAVQYAVKVAGFSRVIGVCSANNADLVKGLASDPKCTVEVIDYAKGALSSQIALGSVDYVFDTVTSPEDPDYTDEARKVLKDGGFLTQINSKNPLKMGVAMTGLSWPQRNYDVLMADVSQNTLNCFSQLINTGAVRPLVLDPPRPFSHASVEEGFTSLKGRRQKGKVVFDF